MAKKALIHPARNNRICDVVDAANVFPVHAGLQWVDCPDDCTTNWTYDGTNFSAPAAPSLAQVKARRKIRLSQAYGQKIAEGLVYGGKVYQLDEPSQARITSMATRAVAVIQGIGGATWPSGFAWIAADNSTAAMTAAQMFAFAQAAADRVVALRVAFRTKKDEIDALGTVAAVTAYDINAGWP